MAIISLQTNTASIGLQNSLRQTQSSLKGSLSRLSSGYRINRPNDDAAGLAVSSRFNAINRMLKAARDNISNAVSFTQTQSGYLRGTQKVLNRMGELAMRAQDATIPDSMRELYNKEFQELKGMVKQAQGAEFNGSKVFDGTAREVTVNETDSFSMPGVDMGGTAYEAVVTEGVDISTANGAAAAMDLVKTAGTQAAGDLAGLGATLSRLDLSHAQNLTTSENLLAATNRITDTNVAVEATRLAQSQILNQSGIQMLQQANVLPGIAMKLLS
ncbi:MAG: flagellin [Verrucomicrobiota bacterium]|nr:flagellin [Verrucomicrobiota bacterium]